MEKQLAQEEHHLYKYFSIGVTIIVVIVLILLFIFKGSVFNNPNQDSINIAEDSFAGRYDEAIKIGEELLRNGRADRDVLISLAGAYLQKGSATYSEEENSHKAIEVTDKIISIDVNDSEAYRLKGYAYEIVEDFENAILNYEKAIGLNPDEAAAYSQLGHAYDLMGDKTKALEYYEKALEINPFLDHALLNSGRVNYFNNNIDVAKENFTEVLRLSLDVLMKAHAAQLLGSISFEDGDLGDAEKYFKDSVTFDPGFSTGWASLANVYYEQISGPEDVAGIQRFEDTVNKTLVIQSNNTFAFILKGDLEFFMRENHEQAKSFYDQAMIAVDTDITLGVDEKDLMKNIITTELEKLEEILSNQNQ